MLHHKFRTKKGKKAQAESLGVLKCFLFDS